LLNPARPERDGIDALASFEATDRSLETARFGEIRPALDAMDTAPGVVDAPFGAIDTTFGAPDTARSRISAMRSQISAMRSQISAARS
jgi:hypothetical protein